MLEPGRWQLIAQIVNAKHKSVKLSATAASELGDGIGRTVRSTAIGWRTPRCAKDMPGPIATMADGGTLLHALEVYVQKIAIGSLKSCTTRLGPSLE
jgi:hypothetical protein